MLTGWIDRIEGGVISGWAFDDDQPTVSIELLVYVGGKLFTTVSADHPRPDLQFMGTGRVEYGFASEAPPRMRSDEVIFARYKDEFIIPIPGVRRPSLSRFLHHASLLDASAGEVVYAGESSTDDTTIAERICRSLDVAASAGPKEYGALWGALSAEQHHGFANLARSHDIDAVSAYLAKIGCQPLAVGFIDGPDTHSALSASPAFRSGLATMILDRVISLAESLGCISVENPEQGPFGMVANVQPDELLSQVTTAVNIPDLRIPVGGFWGLATSFGILNARAIEALYAASRMAVICDAYQLRGVTEIGGGAGIAAYYALLAGIRPYRIIDIPAVGAVQAYTLRDCGGLMLHGEKDTDQPISLAPPWEFARSSTRHHELLFNMDSLPEIESEAALAYLVDARINGYRFFFSINQESGFDLADWSQGKVRGLAARAGGYRMLSRHRAWLRPGYVEELYRIESA
jgi:hypothetical protein